MDDEDAQVKPVLLCRLDNARPLADSLSCIYSPQHKAQDVQLHVPSTGGLRFTVEENLCLQACVTLRAEAFASFECTNASLYIRLSLGLLLDCLNLFSGVWDKNQTAVRIMYKGHGHPLEITLQESDVVTQCQLNTIESDSETMPDFEFFAHEIHNKAIVQSDALKDALAELDYAGAATAELRLAPSPPRFRFQSPALTSDLSEERLDAEDSAYTGPLCSVELPDPSDRTSTAFLEFTSMRAQHSCYRLSLLQRCVKALSMSDTCRIRMNEDGMLSLVCLMRTAPAGASSDRAYVTNRYFTEFLIAAEEIIETESHDASGSAGSGGMV